MAPRKVPLITGEHYHIFTRSTMSAHIFQDTYDILIAEKCLRYYTRIESYPKFSYWLQNQNTIPLEYSNLLVLIEAYCIMPTHIHFLLKQVQDKGIELYMQKFLTSYSHYYNKKHHQFGSIFGGRFKATHIGTEEQFMHVSRYIHLNPTSAGIVKNPTDYPYTSLSIYLGGVPNLPIDPTYVLASFNSPANYLNFVNSRKDYQRKLQYLKSLLIDYDEDEPGSSLEITDPGSETKI